MISHQITVNIPNHPYPIYVGFNLLNDSQLFSKHIPTQQVMIVTNKTVANLFLSVLKKTLSSHTCDFIILPDGEQYKTLANWSLILDKLVECNHHRDSTLITLGGGVIGDMGGFAAAVYQRGINFIQIPTTLLSQVDASIGGKTAVNHPAGKNLIGAFYQPNAVMIDINTLSTLPSREFNAGLSEIVKAALIKEAKFFKWLEHNCDFIINQEKDALLHAISTACQIKADIVALDQQEHNIRALLNLGHTFAHAIEHVLGYGDWLHGEAVATGLVLAAKLSVIEGTLNENDLNRITTLLSNVNLPVKIPNQISFSALYNAMRIDKKIKKNQMHFILLKEIGNTFISKTISENKLKMLYSSCSQP